MLPFAFKRPDVPLPDGRKLHVKLAGTDSFRTSVQVLNKGGENNLHYHPNMDLMYMVLKGRVAFYGPGDKLVGEFGVHEGVMLPRTPRATGSKRGRGGGPPSADRRLSARRQSLQTHPGRAAEARGRGHLDRDDRRRTENPQGKHQVLMRGPATLGLLAGLALAAPALAQPPEAEFFRGKTISLGVPSSVGGGYDT